MDNRSAVQGLWRTALNGLARLNQLLAEDNPADGSIFRSLPHGSERAADTERRIAEARKARLRI
jgi:hypothetical protein